MKDINKPINDQVAKPAHYTAYGPIEPISICRLLNFNLGNVFKYACRAPFKGGAVDIDKAVRYLEIELELHETKACNHFWGAESAFLDMVGVVCDFARQIAAQDNLSGAYQDRLIEFVQIFQSSLVKSWPDDRLKESLLALKAAL